MPRSPLSRRAVIGAGMLGALGLTMGAGADPDVFMPAADDAARAEDMGFAAGAPGTVLRAGRHEVVWSVPAAGPLVALTFDDGPHPHYTPRILTALQAARVTATFNVMGVQAARHPQLLADVVAAGHEIGNHTHTHADLSKSDSARTRAELRDTQDRLQQFVQQPVRLFRPPRGELTGLGMRVAAELDLDVVMWSLDRGPGGVGTPKQVSDHIGRHAAAGDIIALHDGLGHAGLRPASATARYLARRREVEVRALPRMLELLTERGFTAVPVTTLLRRAEGLPLVNHPRT